MRNYCLVILCVLSLACKNKTYTLKTRDGEEVKVALPRGIKLATDSLHINITDKLSVNAINWKILGTEPFWNISVTGDSVTYYSIENQAKGEGFIITSSSENRDGKGVVTAYEYTLNNSDRSNIIIRKEPCSDGMSDKIYPYSAKITYGDLKLKGCAEMK